MPAMNAPEESNTPPTTSLVARDARVSWHPYTQHGIEDTPLAVKSARGSLLTLADGTQIIDAIHESSRQGTWRNVAGDPEWS